MRSIRGGMGLGDALYVQAVARHFVLKGERLKVCTAWPDVFRPLGDGVVISPFTRVGIDILAHYSARKPRTDTNQFQDVCISAGIQESVEFRLDWTPTDQGLLGRLREFGKPILCVQLPRVPMGRTDGFGGELLPDCRVMQEIIDRLHGRVLTVQIGAGKPLHKFTGIDVDLANKTSVTQLLDVASIASGFLGYVSFVVPLAECMSKPSLLVWSQRGLRCGTMYVRQITPQKVLHAPTSMHIVDNWSEDQASPVEERFANAICGSA